MKLKEEEETREKTTLNTQIYNFRCVFFRFSLADRLSGGQRNGVYTLSSIRNCSMRIFCVHRRKVDEPADAKGLKARTPSALHTRNHVQDSSLQNFGRKMYNHRQVLISLGRQFHRNNRNSTEKSYFFCCTPPLTNI